MTDFRARVRAGEALIGAFSDLGSPLAVELLGRAGFDWIVLDLEHGSATEADLLGLLQATELGGAAALVRPESAERLRIGRALDLGAAGIMLPRLESVAQVRDAMTSMRYPPAGIRGVALRARGAGLGSVAHADVGTIDERVVGIVQIESAGALAEADAIAAIDGVDVLFVGPGDLTHSLGIPGRFGEPAYREALEAVVAACRAHDKSPGILVYDTGIARDLIDMGFRFVGIGADGALVADGAKAALADVRR